MPNILTFYIGGSSTEYTLHVSRYSGRAGDGLAYQHGSKFTTTVNDSDLATILLVAHKDIQEHGGIKAANSQA